VTSVVLATVGTFVLVAFVRTAEGRAVAGERLVPVLVVRERVPAGTPASALQGRIGTEKVPAKVRSEGAVGTLTVLENRVAAVDLLPGEQVTRSRFVTPDLQHRGQVGVPEGLLEVTVSLEPERAVGGVLRPGSSVAVLASFEPFEVSSEEPVRLEGRLIPKDGKTPDSTHLILHKILVTNVQSETSFKATSKDEEGTAPAPGENLLVTLAVDGPSAERVVFAAEHGTIWLAVEPKDAPEAGTAVQTRASIYEMDVR
jgi:pilus assembly protein CpaB